MKVLFAGPSLSGDLDAIVESSDSITCAGPVARGDVLSVVQQGAVAIGIVDGRFEDTLSVWHKEILYALSLGVAVAGAASMGALRAAECAAFGMIGIGEVYRRYANGEPVDDADVGQIHAPAELNYLPLSEPLVNIEPTLAKMASAGLISAFEQACLLRTARSVHYKDRNYAYLFRELPGLSSGRLSALIDWSARFAVNQKRLDALKLIEWLRAQPLHRSQPPQWTFSETSHWRALLASVNASGSRLSA